MSSKSAIKLLNNKAQPNYRPLRLPARILSDEGSVSPMCLEHLVVLTMDVHHVAPMSVPWFKMNHPLSMTLETLGVCCSHHAEFLLKNSQVSARNRKTVVGSSPCGATLGNSPSTLQPNPKQKTCSGDGFPKIKLHSSGFKRNPRNRLLSYVLDQRDLRIEFAHLIAKRQLHSVMEELRQHSKSSAQDERGYGSVNPGTVHRKAAKKPRTTYTPAVDPKSQQPSGSQPGAGLPVPTSSVARGYLATSQASGASQSTAVPGGSVLHGTDAPLSDQGGRSWYRLRRPMENARRVTIDFGRSMVDAAPCLAGIAKVPIMRAFGSISEN
ncbi:Hypothetical protein PHPALM_10020 [Phytophthora palmivora]|uniref:Uncharacterized protein n=1 Tax=Phytophthora palmivora TaxID=4796 RepID=A0A2P4Y5U3_9STRA|nr:Hypothetical protein PHPALM_10020 [Phytophthora palmivora]